MGEAIVEKIIYTNFVNMTEMSQLLSQNINQLFSTRSFYKSPLIHQFLALSILSNFCEQNVLQAQIYLLKDEFQNGHSKPRERGDIITNEFEL